MVKTTARYKAEQIVLNDEIGYITTQKNTIILQAKGHSKGFDSYFITAEIKEDDTIVMACDDSCWAYKTNGNKPKECKHTLAGQLLLKKDNTIRQTYHVFGDDNNDE